MLYNYGKYRRRTRKKPFVNFINKKKRLVFRKVNKYTL